MNPEQALDFTKNHFAKLDNVQRQFWDSQGQRLAEGHAMNSREQQGQFRDTQARVNNLRGDQSGAVSAVQPAVQPSPEVRTQADGMVVDNRSPVEPSYLRDSRGARGGLQPQERGQIWGETGRDENGNVVYGWKNGSVMGGVPGIGVANALREGGADRARGAPMSGEVIGNTGMAGDMGGTPERVNNEPGFRGQQPGFTRNVVGMPDGSGMMIHDTPRPEGQQPSGTYQNKDGTWTGIGGSGNEGNQGGFASQEEARAWSLANLGRQGGGSGGGQTQPVQPVSPAMVAQGGDDVSVSPVQPASPSPSIPTMTAAELAPNVGLSQGQDTVNRFARPLGLPSERDAAQGRARDVVAQGERASADSVGSVRVAMGGTTPAMQAATDARRDMILAEGTRPGYATDRDPVTPAFKPARGATTDGYGSTGHQLVRNAFARVGDAFSNSLSPAGDPTQYSSGADLAQKRNRRYIENELASIQRFAPGSDQRSRRSQNFYDTVQRSGLMDSVPADAWDRIGFQIPNANSRQSSSNSPSPVTKVMP